MMVQNGVEPDDHTSSFVLKVCVDYSEIRKGKKAHGLLFKLDFDLDLFVGNTLLLFYSGCGYLSDAEKGTNGWERRARHRRGQWLVELQRYGEEREFRA
ncbi:Pentatricopeptide repeat-containing protein [Camellia lanceoleosa]|uniref:Pentatricopeptide repeat-containing protein n=1 Tax=Camellia lanceoleosa TaxID=1840588 RepID=A0ACC0GRY2_9ERIC|nr:Pentatricopeptide repeat-containing protein [Camellia lanceoleosa]